MFGDAQAVINRAVAAGGVQTRRAAQQFGRYAGQFGDGFRRIFRFGDEGAPFVETLDVATLVDEGFVDQAFGDDDVGQRGNYGDIGAGTQFQVIVGLDMRAIANQVDLARVDHDQFGALAQTAFHQRSENRMAVGRVGADYQNHVGLHDRIEGLGAGRFAEGGFQAVTGRRMANAGASVDIVIAEAARINFCTR